MRYTNRRPLTTAMLALAAGLATVGEARAQTVFYSEGFDTAVLDQLSGDPRVTGACGNFGPRFTHNPPSGWSWNACGVPSYFCRVGTCAPDGTTCGNCGNDQGVYEWEGWSFVNKDWWVQVAGDQTRSQFTLGTGNVAVADADEWDDRGDPDVNCGKYNAWMGTPSISLADITPGTGVFAMSSSWRPEGFDDLFDNNQTAIVRAYYTVGGIEQAPVEVLHWDSDTSGSFFHPDSQNEAVSISLADAPSGAQSVRFEFGLVLAANDWWWAVDNIAVSGDVAGTPTQLFFEGFEGVTLEAPVHEIPTGCGITYCGEFTHTHAGPNGVHVTVASPASGGVPDGRGWSFVNRPFWQCASGGPNGSAFNNSSQIVAVADGDEFDDLAHEPGALDTTLATPSFSLAGRTGNLVVLSFDSSWRWEAGQTVNVIARYNNGITAEVARWESDPFSPNFKPDAVNERVVVPLVVPEFASAVALEFHYVGGNNWWWAIDNISVFEGQAQVSLASVTPVQSVMTLAPTVDFAACFTPWSPDVPAGWSESFNPIGSCPTECGRAEWRGWSFGFHSWWSTQVDTQNRELFTRANGVVAIADPDEWDDVTNGQSNFNAFMSTPSISLPGSISNAVLALDSSWRPEGFDDSCSCNPGFPTERTNNQTAKITAFYTVGGNEHPGVDVLHWDSDEAGAFFHGDNENEAVALGTSALAIPTGAQSVRFEFSLTNARNDWWWALDNINFSVNGATAFTENFEGVPNLQQAPTENPPVNECLYFAPVSAQGGSLTVDNSGLTGCTSSDFTGFASWVVNAWARVQGGERLNFGADTAFVSDHDAGNCDGVGRLVTPVYAIGALLPETLNVAFRSSWGSALGHASSVEVRFDGGAWVPVLNWNPGNKSTTADEIVTLAVANPAGAQTAQFRFNDAESGWWAITNLDITGTVGTPPCLGDYDRSGGVDGDDVIAFFGDWDANLPGADVDDSGGVDGDDVILFFARWDSGC